MALSYSTPFTIQPSKDWAPAKQSRPGIGWVKGGKLDWVTTSTLALIDIDIINICVWGSWSKFYFEKQQDGTFNSIELEI